LVVSFFTASSASVGVTANLPDGRFSLYARAYPTGTAGGGASGWPFLSSGVLNPAVPADVVTSGARVAAAVASYDAFWDFPALAGVTAYTAVFVAVDAASGQTFAAAAPFVTADSPPFVSVPAGGVVTGVDRATVPVLAGDRDTPFTVVGGFSPRSVAVTPAVLAAVAAAPLLTRSFPRSPGGTAFAFQLTGLAQLTDYRFVVVATDSTGLFAFDVSDFSTVSQINALTDAEYDGAWSLSYRAAATYQRRVAGCVLGNGKLAVRTALDRAGAEAVYLAGAFDFSPFGGYTNNLVQTFETCGLTFASGSNAAGAFVLRDQTLNMQTGVATSRGTVALIDPGTLNTPGGNLELEVELDVAALRQMPFCLLVTARVLSRVDVPDLRVFHAVRAAPNMLPAHFDCSSVYTADGPVTVLAAEAALSDGGSSASSAAAASPASAANVAACATVYFPAAGTAGGAPARGLGFNTYRGRDHAFNGFSMSLAAGRRAEFSLLTAHASGADFRDPASDCRRMALGALGNYGTAARLRADHVAAWARTWLNSVNLVAKTAAPAAAAADAQRVRRALRYAQFNMFAFTRDASATEVNPAAADSLDLDGNLFWNRELWLLPAMLYLKPRFVRTMLEYRYRSLSQARALAGSQGFEGVKYTFAGDILGNDLAPYWDVTPGSYAFNTCLVGVAAWDYFRATRDRDWLISKGYAILAGVADYVCSVIGEDGAVLARSVGGQDVSRPAFTLYSAKLALKGAVEASYELKYAQPAAWLARFLAIQLDFFEGANFEVLKEHAGAAPGDPAKLLEAAMVMQAHYSSRFFKDLTRRSTDRLTLVANAAYYDGKAAGAYAANPFNRLMLANLYAQLSYTAPGNEAKMEALVLSAVTDSAIDVWGGLHASPDAKFNDVSLSALLVLFFVTGVAGVRVTGGVAASGYYYDKPGIERRTFAYLPVAWEALFVTDSDGLSHRVWNRNAMP
jgi:hypothetical protein